MAGRRSRPCFAGYRLISPMPGGKPWDFGWLRVRHGSTEGSMELSARWVALGLS